MEDYKLRVIQEKDALDIKIQHLNKFIVSSIFDTISIKDQNLLRKQHALMVQYSDVLAERIARF